MQNLPTKEYQGVRLYR